jgi:PAS domain S-box-containing protein
MKAGAARPARAALEARLHELEKKNLQLVRTLQLVEEERAAFADRYDFAPLGFINLDEKGCLRELNLTAARLLGGERSRLLSIPFFTCVTRASCREFLRHLRRCRAEKSEVTTEVVLRPAGRPTIPVELRSVPVLDLRHGDTVYRTTITDISERILAGQALRDSEERYRAVVELSPDGIFILIDGEIVLVNQAAMEFCGADDPQELAGHRFVDLVRPSYRKNTIIAALRVEAGSRTAPVEVKLARPDGVQVEVEVAARDFTYQGYAAVLVTARDIRQRRKAERQVLAISEREKARFGRDLHDGLCQSLGGAACLAEALRNRLRQESSCAAGAAEEIAVLLRQCMDEARGLAKGLYPVSMENTGLVVALHELAREVTHRSGIECSVQCHDSIAIHDATVATNLYRIAQEAIANAIKHGAAKSVLIDLAQDDGRTTLRLQDDGRGIPAKPKETGMGLYTMRYRAAMIGGTLDLQRTVPRGTILTCSFPSNGKSK